MWVRVTTAVARSERRTVGADCSADRVGRRFGSARPSVAVAVAALRSERWFCGLRQLHTPHRRGHGRCQAGPLEFTFVRCGYRCMAHLEPARLPAHVCLRTLAEHNPGLEAETNGSIGGSGCCSGMRSSTDPCQKYLAGACPVPHCPTRARFGSDRCAFVTLKGACCRMHCNALLCDSWDPHF